MKKGQFHFDNQIAGFLFGRMWKKPDLIRLELESNFIVIDSFIIHQQAEAQEKVVKVVL